MLFPSSSPKGAPWTLQVPAFFEPKPITVLKITIVGAFLKPLAFLIAFLILL